MKLGHDFDEDILAAARNAAKRYQCSKSHIKVCEDLAVGIFDKIKKSQGFDDRDRLLLRIAVILHGCGKFISLSNAGESAYHIIMAMDIIGLSEEEKDIKFYSIRIDEGEEAVKRFRVMAAPTLLFIKGGTVKKEDHRLPVEREYCGSHRGTASGIGG